jgi:hypothetical protein
MFLSIYIFYTVGALNLFADRVCTVLFLGEDRLGRTFLTVFRDFFLKPRDVPRFNSTPFFSFKRE